MAREELKTIEGWHKSGCNSWDEYCKPGDMVDQGVADYFLDILPPRTMTRDYFQVGEPHSHAINPKTMKNCGTYATFAVRGKEIWEYCGNCFPHMCVDVEKFKKRDSVQAFLHETYRWCAGLPRLRDLISSAKTVLK